ncbi:3-oxoacyl-[acyl-carrier-protein] synthase 3 [Arenibacter antarcticus]|uniref:3-oxoacyl-ACP synthase III family protein n=1 Tax=Arenibacter antarcticus TaxID=2040469 RepID=A0ABW5VCT2_9FLAO|nr:ketoacyl-ACP synthase III [Arenibacter sp. H213]MCM4168470.1 3-oxoacyl-ACP synthase [Arenibacter sp. H213]
MKIGITGTGSYLPSVVTKNVDFLEHEFLNDDGTSFNHSNEVIIQKFRSITGIEERRYATKDINTSNMAFFAAEKAIADAGIDKEELDYIIFAHNFGDVSEGKSQGDTLPSLATRVKHQLKINNPKCVAYDLMFGCPGWLEGVIQANAFIKSGIAKKCLVIGAETLSRVVDKHDRDSMIYSDGAGATIVESREDNGQILAHNSATYANGEAYFLFFGDSFSKQVDEDHRYIKMYGRKIYEFAITNVPLAMKECLDQSGVAISEVNKIFIHQANEKMDEAIIKRFYKLYNQEMPKGIMPMTIAKLGNSSVATIPTLFDMVKKGKVENQSISKGDVVIFASVGAGMNVNAIVYRV